MSIDLPTVIVLALGVLALPLILFILLGVVVNSFGMTNDWRPPVRNPAPSDGGPSERSAP